ncbi:hypothetical protein ACVWW4_000860 [Bradyrhizobium sp. LB7.1]
MPRYRVLQNSFLKQASHAAASMIEAGEEIEFGGRPGLSLMPLDAAARAAKLASIPNYYASISYQDGQMVFRMARSLGAPDSIKTWTEAREFIRAWKTANTEKAGV